MKIGVISDTHIPTAAKELPQEILLALKGVDLIIHAGDLVELSVLEQLKALSVNVKAVYGNMDSAQVKKVLPEKEVFKTGNFKIGLMHGYGHPNNLMDLIPQAFKNDSVDLIIFGHSHQALNERKDNMLYFNPGSPTDKIFAPYNSYGIIEINDKIEARIIRI
ncbi:MAG: metallophosphoesterase [Candidatus Omnitrophica bacterium]|nr:metallophosphoesterase [Candidatus Omnitrophota bacterium]